METTERPVSHAKPKNRKAKPTTADAVRKMRQTTIDVAPPPIAPELAFVPIDLIDCAAQVRTEFDEENIRELASDIASRGILQPVLLRRTGERFLMIAGERRLRAARLAQLAALPAIVGETDDDTAADMQLAENIQRQDLSLSDLAKAVRSLFERLGSLQAVANRLHKSKSWASKHLALSHPDFPEIARQLIEDGKCEDMETLYILKQIHALDPTAAYQLASDIRNGNAGRQTARDLLDRLKNPPDEEAPEEKTPTEQNQKQTPRDGDVMRMELEDINRRLILWNRDYGDQNGWEIDLQAIQWAINSL